MREEDKRQLFRILLAELDRVTTKKRGGRRRIWDAIYAAHNGRPDGFLVTTDNMSLFRRYRNSISPNPDHMIDAALAYGKSRADDARLVDAGEAMEEERTGWGVM